MGPIFLKLTTTSPPPISAEQGGTLCGVGVTTLPMTCKSSAMVLSLKIFSKDRGLGRRDGTLD